MLLQEVQRRVNDNLQLICSLLELQMHTSSDLKATQACAEALTRVRLIGLVYEMCLRSGEPNFVDIAEMLPTLVQHVHAIHPDIPKDIALDLHTGHVMLSPDAAVTLALLTHELLLHTFTHAFPSGWNAHPRTPDRPSIRIALAYATPDEAVLRLSHNGVGELSSTAYHTATTLGPQLIRVLAAQLRGMLDIEEGGTTFVVTFPAVRPDRQGTHNSRDRME